MVITSMSPKHLLGTIRQLVFIGSAVCAVSNTGLKKHKFDTFGLKELKVYKARC